MNQPRSPHARGFSLLEAMVALVLIGIAILIATSFLDTQARSAARVRAQQVLLRQIESTMEGVRAGVIPLSTRTVASFDPSLEVLDLRTSMVVRTVGPPGLYQVEVTATGTVRGRPVSRSLTTRVWRP